MLAERGMARADLVRLLERAQPWLAKAERMMRPRWPWFILPGGPFRRLMPER